MKQIMVDGRLGRDAEIKVSGEGRQYVNFSLANNTYIKSGYKTTWYDVVCFDPNTVQKRVEFLKKGTYIYVTGLHDATPYNAKDGSLRVSESILAHHIEFIKVSKNEDNKPSNPSQTETNEPSTYSAPQPSAVPSEQPAPVTVNAPMFTSNTSDEEEELPF